jgi:hypothetical protein
MEHEGSFPCSTKYTIGPYDSLFESTVKFYTPSKIQFNIILPSRRWSLKPLNFSAKKLYTFFIFSLQLAQLVLLHVMKL